MNTDIKNGKHFVVGYIGSDRLSVGKALAEELDCPLLVMDDEIERLDGRKIFRVVMVNGEHEYRNMEFDLISKLINPAYDHGIAKDEEYPENLVIVCGDGVILDAMACELLETQHCIFADEDPETLWERVKDDKSIPYFFMANADPEQKRKTFMELYNIRKPLYLKLASS